jgi:hypothetical protein
MRSETTDKEYGDLMSFLLYHRGRFDSDQDFNKFILETLRTFVYDLRDFEVYISINPNFSKGAWREGWQAPIRDGRSGN